MAQDPVKALTYQSRFATYARSLPPEVRVALHLKESTVLAVEGIVLLCKALTSEIDSRPWQERIEDIFSEVTEERLQVIFAAFVEEIEASNPQAWMDRFKNGSYQLFAARLLGPARYRTLIKALKEDGAVIALAIRRGVRALAPFTVAWSDAINLMSRNQLKNVTKADLLAFNAFQMLVSLDDFLGERLLESLPMEVTSATTTDLSSWAPDGTGHLVAKFRTLVTESSSRRIERANSPLVRKIRGARDALKYSEDGISQAANSLIELLDRIMRESYPPQAVLTWVDTNVPNRDDLTVFDAELGRRRPTKRGEALCFVHGGGPVMPRTASQHDSGEGPILIHEVLALVLVTARNKLQYLKHSDDGTPEEREQLMSVLSALEGALMLGLTIGTFSTAPTDAAELAARAKHRGHGS